MSDHEIRLKTRDLWLIGEAISRELRQNRSLSRADRDRLAEIKEKVIDPECEAACPVTIVDGPGPCMKRE